MSADDATMDARARVSCAAQAAHRLEDREGEEEEEEDGREARNVCEELGEAGAALARGKKRRAAFYAWYARECASALAAAMRSCAGRAHAASVCLCGVSAAESISRAWRDVGVEDAEPRVLVCAAAAGAAAACSGGGDSDSDDANAVRRAVRMLLLREICWRDHGEREALMRLIAPPFAVDDDEQDGEREEQDEGDDEGDDDDDDEKEEAIRLRSVALLGGGLALFLVQRIEPKAETAAITDEPMRMLPLLDRFLLHGVTSGELHVDVRGDRDDGGDDAQESGQPARASTTTVSAVAVFNTLLHGTLRSPDRLRIIEALLVRAEDAVPVFYRSAVAALLLSNVPRAVADDDSAIPTPCETAVRIVVMSLAPVCSARDSGRDSLSELVHAHADRLIGGVNVLRFLLLHERKDDKYRRALRERDVAWNLSRLRVAVDAARQAADDGDDASRGNRPLGLEILDEVLGRVEDIVK